MTAFQLKNEGGKAGMMWVELERYVLSPVPLNYDTGK